MSVKVAYNACYGGFGLSIEAEKRLIEKLGIEYEDSKVSKGICVSYLIKPKKEHKYLRRHYDTEYYYLDVYNIPRHDKKLTEVIEELGKKANGEFSDIEIYELSENTKVYKIEEYDGMEKVIEGDSDWVCICKN
jgi:hypothetical protein